MPPKGRASRRSAFVPIPGPDAFKDMRRPEYLHSQAASLLLIGADLRGDPQAREARFAATIAAPAAQPKPFPPEDLSALGFPGVRVTGDRFHPTELREMTGVRFRAAVRPRPEEARRAPQTIAAAANDFYRQATSESAAALLENALRHPDPLVRVSAAASYVDVAVDPQPAIRILENGLTSKDLLVRDVAAYALARVDPKNPALAKLLRPRKVRTRRKPSRTSTIVHGTWASGSSWWQPGGDFWTYLHDNVDANVYGASDRFGWTGGYSDAARALAGTELHDWAEQHSLDGLDLYTHSHGGNVAMLATQAGTRAGKLVLLSCPVHWPKYTPQFGLVGKAVSVRVHLDLVILADRGGQRFPDPRIQEHVLPVWFDHFATHDPANWRKYDVPAML